MSSDFHLFKTLIELEAYYLFGNRMVKMKFIFRSMKQNDSIPDHRFGTYEGLVKE